MMEPGVIEEVVGQLGEASEKRTGQHEESCAEVDVRSSFENGSRVACPIFEVSSQRTAETSASRQLLLTSKNSSHSPQQRRSGSIESHLQTGPASQLHTLTQLPSDSVHVSQMQQPAKEILSLNTLQPSSSNIGGFKDSRKSSGSLSEVQVLPSADTGQKQIRSNNSRQEKHSPPPAISTSADLNNMQSVRGTVASSSQQFPTESSATETKVEAEKDVSVVMAEECNVVYNVLEKLFADKKLGRAETDLCKQRLIKLYSSLIVMQQKERDASHKATDLTEQLEGHRDKLDKLLTMTQQNRTDREELEQSMRNGQIELAHSEESEKVLQLQIGELRKEKDELELTLSERTEQIRESFGVLVEAATTEIDCIKAQKRRQEESKEAWGKQRILLETRQEKLNREIEKLKTQVDAMKQDLEYASLEAPRNMSQADQFRQVINSLRTETTAVEQELTLLNQRETQGEERLKKLDNQIQVVKTQLQTRREDVLTAEASERTLTAKLGEAKFELLKTLESKRVIEVQAKERKTHRKMLRDLVARHRNLFDRAKLDYKKKVSARDAIFSQIPTLVSTRENQLKEKKQLEEEIKQKEATRRMVAAENQTTSRSLAEQDADTKERLEAVELAYRKAADLEREIQNLKAELDTWTHHVYTSMTHKEKILRGVAAAHQRVTEAQVLANVKEDEEKHLGKRQRDLNKSLSECQKLLDNMRIECNKYITLKQKADQQAAEMAERHRILSNEVETLRLQEEAKTTGIERTRLQTQKATEQRSWLRSEQSLLIQKVKEETERMEEHVIEIDRLNNIINMIEKEMLDNKNSYESAVESRSLAGIQLIDRNDELCLLWETSSSLEKSERRSQEALTAKEKDVASLGLYLQELQRQIFAKRKRSEEVPVLEGEVEKLKQELERERRERENISLKLENPVGGRQWNELGGDDMDMETLSAKYQAIEHRFRSKKRDLMDKDLDLEELTELTSVMRGKADTGRQGALLVLTKIQDLQTKLEQLDRKGMVIASELKLYQTALPQFLRVKDDIESRVRQARENLYFDKPPTPTSEEQFEEIIKHVRLRRKLFEEFRARQKGEEHNTPALRTTAEPRPTQYIPDDGGIGLPVAYGANPPFKPFPSDRHASLRNADRNSPRNPSQEDDKLRAQ